MEMHRWAMIVVMAIGVILLRAFPFLVFGRTNKHSKMLRYLGLVIASASIAMLVIYSLFCVGVAGVNQDEQGMTLVALIAASALTVGLQVLLRNPLISIVCGTALYMILIR